MRYALLVEYDGSGFSGWARQTSSVRTIQGVIDQAIYQFTGESALTYGAGRTDAGVHAYGQVCHVDLQKSYELQRIRDATNYYLRDYLVSIIDVQEVDPEFHATRSATARHYMYHILCRPAKSALFSHRCYHTRAHLAVDTMQEAANYLVGEHDFSTFRCIRCQSKTSVRTIFSANFEVHNDNIYFHIIGSAFLYNQVRIILGTLIEVGTGKITPDQFKKILKSHNRKAASATLLPYGLYLKRVFYPPHLSPFGHVLEK